MDCIVDAKTGVVTVTGNDAAMRRANMSCTPAQMRVVLHRAGHLSAVNAAVSGDPEAEIVWEYATVISRVSPLIDKFKADVGLSDNEIDALFDAAAGVSF